MANNKKTQKKEEITDEKLEMNQSVETMAETQTNEEEMLNMEPSSEKHVEDNKEENDFIIFSPSAEEMEKECLEAIKNDETLKECNEIYNGIDEKLKKIENLILEDKDGAIKLMKDEIKKAQDAIDKINAEIKEPNLEKCSEEATKKLSEFFKQKNFSQFWNGMSSGFDN